jgi:hypothetical protein
MKTTKTTLITLALLVYCIAFSQTKDTTNTAKSKTKKQEYIESYITNFP